MSRRNFGTIKSLLHFDFPYYNEPNEGLDDEIGLETWKAENDNVKLYGSISPVAGTRAPKFGYRCLRPYKGSVLGTNTTGIWNLNSSGDYEIEFFAYIGSSSDRQLITLLSSAEDDTSAVFRLSSNTTFVFDSDGWGITATTGSTSIKTGSWGHILLRIRDHTLTVYQNALLILSLPLPPNLNLSVEQVRLGYTSSTTSFYIDEFVFRHSAGAGTPVIPTESYNGVLDISKVGGFGNGSDGDVTISTNGVLGKVGAIASITNGGQFTVRAWSSTGSYSAQVGGEIMIHVTSPKSTYTYSTIPIGDYPLVGLYAFGRIKTVSDTSITLEKAITIQNGYDFDLNSDLISTYCVQAIVVPNFNSLTIDSGIIVSPQGWSTSTGGGIVAFRCTGDCTVNGSIITHGYGAVRYDLLQMTNSKLIDRFLCSQGGGIFIACGGTFTAPSTARLGASWSGDGDGSNGAAGYGGKGSDVNPSASVSVSGGAGGLGGGGGGAACASAQSTATATGGALTGDGSSATIGGGGGGCGGNGGNGSSYAGGSGGGGQGGSWGSGGTGKAQTSYGRTNAGNSGNGANGGDSAWYDTAPNNQSSYTFYPAGAGGGAPGGNGGGGYRFKSVSNSDHAASGVAGASIILICRTLALDSAALSTGGGAGPTYAYESGYTKLGGSGGGGTGFCYIACDKKVSA